MPTVDVGGISFYKCIFSISAGEGKITFDIESIVSDVIAEIKKNTSNNDELLKNVSSPLFILRNNFSQQSQTIEHIDFGSVSDNTLENIVRTPNGTQARKASTIMNPLKKKNFQNIFMYKI